MLLKIQITFFLLIYPVMVFCCCGKQERETVSENVLYTLFSPNKVVVDGTLDDPAWQQAEQVFLKENISESIVVDSSSMTIVKTCYDEENLYIAFVCKDQDIWGAFTERDQYLWTEEAVEVFIDVDENINTYIEIEVSPNNTLFNSYIVDPFIIFLQLNI